MKIPDLLSEDRPSNILRDILDSLCSEDYYGQTIFERGLDISALHSNPDVAAKLAKKINGVNVTIERSYGPSYYSRKVYSLEVVFKIAGNILTVSDKQDRHLSIKLENKTIERICEELETDIGLTFFAGNEGDYEENEND